MNKEVTHQILKQVAKEFDHGKVTNWKNRDFEDLSFDVHQKTKVLISVATLKRIFGKVKTDENYSPQESTLEALVLYSGISVDMVQKVSKIKYLWLFIGLLLIAGTLYWLIGGPVAEPHKALEGKISLIKTEGTCPTSAYFELDVPDTPKDVFVSFGDESRPLSAKIYKTISHFYAYPGQFVAELKSDGATIAKSEKVLVSTNGWQAFAYYFLKDYEAESRMRYYPIPIEKGLDNGFFYVSPRTISSLGIDTTEIVSVKLNNYKRTHKNGDSFRYKTKIKNSSFWPAIRCYSTIICIEGSLGKVEFKLVGEGCSSYASYSMSELFGTGLDTDLSSLVYNREGWFDLEIVNTDKTVQLIINQQTVFSETYQKSIGNIVGTSIEFHGSGYVDDVLLKVGEECLFEGNF